MTSVDTEIQELAVLISQHEHRACSHDPEPPTMDNIHLAQYLVEAGQMSTNEHMRIIADSAAHGGQVNRSLHGRVEALESTIKAVEEVLQVYGMNLDKAEDFDADFAESLREEGAWRLARDLRKALGRTKS